MCVKNLKANRRDCQKFWDYISGPGVNPDDAKIANGSASGTPSLPLCSPLLFTPLHSSPRTELSWRAIFQPIYFLMWSNLGHLPLGRLYVVINDGYLAKVPEGVGGPSAQHWQVQRLTPGPGSAGQACSRLDGGRQVWWAPPLPTPASGGGAKLRPGLNFGSSVSTVRLHCPSPLLCHLSDSSRSSHRAAPRGVQSDCGQMI